MPVVSATPDIDALTLTLVTELAAPPERVWRLWTEPDQLDGWWGPPTWPARFSELDPRPGGRAAYVMTGPEGEKAAGWWEFLELDEPTALTLDDGFAREDGSPDPSMPVTRTSVTVEATGDGSRMTVRSRFADAGQMQQLLDMGMVEGMSQALGQTDAIVARD